MLLHAIGSASDSSGSASANSRRSTGEAGHTTHGTGTGPRREDDLETGTQSALKVARRRLQTPNRSDGSAD